MDDRNVEHLLRMAGEAEELERSALETSDGPRLHHEVRLHREDGTVALVNQSPLNNRRRWITGLVAAGALAAMFTIAALLRTQPVPVQPQPRLAVVQPRPQPKVLPKDHSVSTDSNTSETHLASLKRTDSEDEYDISDVTRWEQLFNRPIAKSERAQHGEQSMVLVIYKSKDDHCTCVEPAEEHFEIGRDYSRVPRSELLSVGLNVSCGQNSDRMLVFGLTGPADSLPRSRAAAAALASCIAAPEHGETDSGSYAAQAASCLPLNVRVVAETMSLAKR